MFKPILLVPVAALLAVAPLSVPANPPATGQAAKPAKISSEVMAKSKKLYAIDCAICHGDAGDGKTDIAKDQQMAIDDWTDAKTLSGKTDQQLFSTIRNGKDKMPPEAEGRAKDEEVWGLIAYIRGMAKAQPAGDAAPAAAPAPAAPNH